MTVVKRVFSGTVTQGLFSPPLSQQRLACLWGIILETRARQLLDLGCGDGALLQYIQAQVGPCPVECGKARCCTGSMHLRQ